MSALSLELRHKLNREECFMYGVGDEYDTLIANGNTPEFAHMIAMRSPPGTKGSEQAFWDGRDDKHRSHGLADMPPFMAEQIVREAKQAGISIQGKWYMGGLSDGRKWRDPEAWVSSKEDVERVAKKRNLTVKGGFYNIQGTPVETPDCPLNPRIVNEHLKEMVAKDPGLLKRRKLEDVKEEIINKHGAPARHKKKRTKHIGDSFVDLHSEI